jgi:hypothetical protein
MKFKLHWGKAKIIQRFRSPLKETDYDGNDLWAMRLPKPEPMDQNLFNYYKYMANSMQQMPYPWSLY